MAVKGTVVFGTAGALGARPLIAGSWGQTTMDVLIQNIDAAGTIYLGGSDVAPTQTGFGVVPGAAITMTLFPNDLIYGTVATSGTVQIQCLIRGLP